MRTFIFFLIISLFQKGYTQTDTGFNIPYKYISLKNDIYKGVEKFDFSDIILLDARADSNKVGFIIANFNDIYKLNYKNGLTADGTNFLNHYYKGSFSESSNSVLVVIKKLWVSQFDTTLKVLNSMTYSGGISFIVLKVEFYLKNSDHYYPVSRIDSSFITTQKFTVTAFGNEIMDGLINCCNKLFSINTTSILQKKKYTLAQIMEFNKQIFDKKILQTDKYRKGVYTTFSDFLNNDPQLTYSGIDRDKYGDVLYLNDGNGGTYASNKFWGYSDGENIYIMSARNFFKLKRTQNTFEFYGFKNLRERFNYRNDFLHKRKPALDMFIYQVNMETGEIY